MIIAITYDTSNVSIEYNPVDEILNYRSKGIIFSQKKGYESHISAYNLLKNGGTYYLLINSKLNYE